MTDNTDTEALSRDDLLARVEELEAQLKTATENSNHTRRSVLAAAAGIAAAGAMGVYATGGASAAPTGEFPQAGDSPLLKIRADRVRLVGRTSDPSTPDDGTMWYRGDL
jgi:hypothetical protein